MKYLIYFIIVAIVLFILKKFLNKFKIPKIGCLVPVVGGVKCGKSTLSVAITLSEFKRNLCSIKFKNFFRKLFKKPLLNLPVIYSNVPLNVDFCWLTRDLLLRKVKPIEHSVVYMQEASLVADSQLIKDKNINNELLLFFKLCGHQGISVILDSQTTSDLHYSIKRSMSQCFYVQSTTKWLPFFLVSNVIEYTFADDGSFVFAQDKDTEFLTRKVLISKSIWKKFDSRSYSALTDDLPYTDYDIVKKGTLKDLKTRRVLSFRPEFNFDLLKESDNEKKENI